MTVEELAVQLGVSVKEAMALCIASGLKVQGPQSRLSERDVYEINLVLTGQKRLRDPRKAGTKRQSTGSGLGGPAAIGIAVLVGVFLLIGGCVAVVLPNLRGDASINVKAGDCFDATLIAGSVFGSGIDPKPCDSAQWRAFGVLDLEAVFTSYPGTDAIMKRAADRCTAIAQGVLNPEEGTVLIYYFGPGDETAWEDPDARKVVCAEQVNGMSGTPFGF